MTIKVSKSVKLARTTSRDKALTTKQVKFSARPVELETEFKQVIDSTSDAIRVINKDFTIRRINQAFAEMSGTDQHEVMGKRCWEIFPSPLCHTPDCRLQRILNGEKTVQVEIERKRKDGTNIPCIVASSPLHTASGELVGIIEIFRDITERKRIEKALSDDERRYTSLFQNAPVALAECDFSLLKVHFDELRNRGVKDFQGYFNRHPDAILDCSQFIKHIRMNQAYHDLFKTTNLAKVNDYFYKGLQNSLKNRKALIDDYTQLANGFTNITKEEEITNFKWEKTQVLTRIFIPPGYEDSWSRVIVSLSDITILKQKEKELLEYQDHLEHMVEKRTNALKEEMERRIEFTKVLVHEMKTPLTPLMGASEALSTLPLNKRYRGLVRNIYVGAQRLNKRIDELLDLTKGEMGILNISQEKIDIQAMIREISEEMIPECDRKNQQFILDLPSHLPFVMADSGRLEQVILNILNNAIKFTPDGGKITLKVFVKDDNLIIEVIDTGCGIAKDKQKHLFKPYQRIMSNQGSADGLGLGLALSKTLVELHQGKIWINSKKGKGSTLGFSIPIINGSHEFV